MMYKFTTSRDQQQATLFTLAHCNSVVVVKATRLQSSHQTQAHSRLLLEFNIHENHEESARWAALEQQLKERFDEVVAGDLLPGCTLKLHIHILTAGPQLESNIANALFACLLLHGLPMRRSVFHYEWQDGLHSGQCVVDLNHPQRLFSSQSNDTVPAGAVNECEVFKRELTAFLSQQWSG